MKKLLSIVLCAILVFGLSSCNQENDASSIDAAYLEGLEQGEENTFFNLYNASSCQKELTDSDNWETEDFSLWISNVEDSVSEYFWCHLQLKNLAIDEAYEDKNVYLGIYSRSSRDTWNKIVSNYEEYYNHVLSEGDYTEGSHYSSTMIKIDNAPMYAVVIIVVNGNLYHAKYTFREK